MERRLMKHGDCVAELSFDKEDGLFHRYVVNLRARLLGLLRLLDRRAPPGLCAVGGALRGDLSRARPRAAEVEAALLTTHDLR